ISNIGRSASGVRVMKTGDGRVSSLAVLEASDEPEDELPDTGETESGGADSPAQDDGLVGITDEEP
ncbi:MAG: hypothetical protein IKX86_01980, partial [Clostridia bacterium]|nr:hypothetical protein [Clostridia bacterium]